MAYLQIASKIITMLNLIPPRLRVVIFEAFPAEAVTAAERIVRKEW